MEKFYLTTAIAYVNSVPHIGFAMEVVQADVLARYQRLCGRDVFFLTGTDEHGSKMAQTAAEQGVTPRKLADRNSEEFRRLTKVLNISNDDFIRTSSERHHEGAKKIWKKLVKAGDIYTAGYEGYYCVGCEAFVQEKDLIDGLCPNHKKKPEILKEENYFFKLSRYSQQIAELIESNQLKIVPDSRRNEILAMAREGLTDVSFSRPKKQLAWGVEVPDDPEQVMYVWCDALSNYITALNYDEGQRFKHYWPADVHLIGKDILRFHAGIWIGMLLSAGIALPKAIYLHGFITSEGQKMSKSLGNVVDPFEMVKFFGVDALRYYLSREIPTTDDGDFSARRFGILYNSDLANNLGNLLNRVVTISLKNLGEKIHAAASLAEDVRREQQEKFDEIWRSYHAAVADFDLKKALELVFQLVDEANLYIDREKPWVLAKEGGLDTLKTVLIILLEQLRQIALMLSPFLPETAEKMCAVLGVKGARGFAELVELGGFEALSVWGSSDFKLKKAEVLFPRIE